MSKKVPPDRDKNSTNMIIHMSRHTGAQEQTLSPKNSVRYDLNKTDSQIQMNSNTQQTTKKLKEILQGKSIIEKRETSIGRLKRKLNNQSVTDSHNPIQVVLASIR